MKTFKANYVHYSICCLLILSLMDRVAAGEEIYESKNLYSSDDDLFKDIPSVYSASKYEQKVTKAPASISIVTGDEIKKYGYRNFGSILSSLKGFFNTNDRNYNYVGVRGFGLPGDYNSRLLLLIDGHRYNDNIYDSFNVDEGFPVDVDIIERVEVVRGPSSSLYGTSAVFGVINVITKRGRDQNGFNLKTSYGTNDTYKTSFSAGNRFSNGLEAFVTGTYYDSSGYNRLFYKEFDAPDTNNGFAEKSDEELARKLMAKLAFGDFSFQGLFVNRRKDVPTASFGTVFNSQMENTTDQAVFSELKYDHTFDNQLNLQSRISYNNFRYTGNYPTATDINKEISYGQWWRAELEATKVLWENHRITLGGQYQKNFHQFQTSFDINTPVSSPVDSPFSSLVDTYQWAMFIQDEFSITNSLTLNAGVRYDYFSIFGSTVNPRLGLIYSPFQNSTVKLLYGTAFRAPNQFELNFIGAGIIASSGLKPEKLETVELILEHYFTSQIRAELNLFHTDISNIIFLTTLNNEDLQHQNVGNIDSNGLEIQLEQLFDNGFQGRVSYSWQENRDKASRQRLSNSPEHMVKLNLIAPLWAEKVFAGYELQYMSGRKTPNGGHVGDYVISNLTVFTQNWIKGVELSAGVYNLFDEQYFDPASDAHRQNAIEQDGITFRIKTSIDY
ncbi:MAG: TonB-dependent receptor [Methylococcaceae bacterium]|nr:TonB-dependent receptor [Methylococcaceae bacterium]